jgi:hypothetical protein
MDDSFRLHFNPEHGIQLLNTGMRINIQAQTAKNHWETALTFSVHADFTDIDVHIQSLIVHTHISPVTIKETFLIESNIGELPRNNWD